MASVKSGVFWNLIRVIIERGLMFAQQIILAWILIPETFGQFSILSSLLAICSLFSTIGLSEVLSNRFKNFSLWLPLANSLYYLLSLISFLLFILIASISFELFNDYFFSIIIYALSLPFISIKSIDTIKLNIDGSYAYVSMARVIYSIILVSVSILFAYLGFTLIALTSAATFAAIAEFFVLRFKTKLSFCFSKNYKRLKRLFYRSLKLMGFNLSWRYINYLDFILIGFFLGDQKAGLYFMAFNLSVQAINLFVSYLPSVLFSSNIRDDLVLDRVNLRTQKITVFLALVTSPIFFGIFFYANQIVSIIFNSNWLGVSPLLQILSLAMIPRVLSSQWYLALLKQKNYNLMTKLSICYFILFIALFIMGIYFFDLIGAVYAILIFYVSNILLAKQYLFSNNPYLKDTILILIIGFICFSFNWNILKFENNIINLIGGLILSVLLFLLMVHLSCKKTFGLIKNLIR